MPTCRSISVCLLTIAVLTAHVTIAQIPQPGIFKDWNYSQSGVFGIIKIENTNGKSYYKISRPDPQSAKIQEYNSSGQVANTTVVRLVNGKLNQMTRTDRWGDTYEITKFTVAGLNEFMVTRRSTGKNDYLPCKGARYIYKNNLLAEIRYMSHANKLCNNASGVAIVRYKRYDDKNRFSLLKEQAFFDEGGNPVISRSSDCHKIVYEYSERGNQASVAYYGTDNEPLTNRFGGFKVRYQYDENDKMIRSEIIGINDEITANAFGVAKTEYEYKNGLIVKQTRFNEKGTIAKASSAGDGIAIIKYEYDDNGNELKRSYFDENNNPMNGNSAYHEVRYTYSASNMLTDIAYFDKYKSASNDSYGIHRYSYIKDDKGRTIQEAYYDKSNLPIKDNHDEAYMIKFKYDEFGREISRSYWKDNTTKMTRWNGYHEQVSKFNEEGLVTEAIYLDEKGNSYTSSTGYSRLVNVYNTNAKLLERKCFNGNAAARVTNSFVQGYHFIKYTYDNNGRIAYVQYFDESGKPANADIDLEDGFSSHKIEFVYKGNRIVEEKFYTASSESPNKFIDCLKNDYVNTNGVNKGYKNQ